MVWCGGIFRAHCRQLSLEVRRPIRGGPPARVHLLVFWQVVEGAGHQAHVRERVDRLGADGDINAAQALGVDSFKYSMIALAISAFMTAMAGTFYANYIFYLHPNSVFGMGLSIELILRPIVGGMGTVLGPVVGSFILTPLSEMSRAYFSKGGMEGLHLILYGIITILVVLFMRRGILVYLKKAFINTLKLEQ